MSFLSISIKSSWVRFVVCIVFLFFRKFRIQHFLISLAARTKLVHTVAATAAVAVAVFIYFHSIVYRVHHPKTRHLNLNNKSDWKLPGFIWNSLRRRRDKLIHILCETEISINNLTVIRFVIHLRHVMLNIVRDSDAHICDRIDVIRIPSPSLLLKCCIRCRDTSADIV